MTNTPAEAPERPPAPPDLGPAGVALWDRLHAEVEFEPHELAVVLLACRQQDDVGRLEELLEEQGPTVVGSMGQPRLNAAFAEVRQARLAVGKLLATLAIPPSEDDRPLTPRQLQGRRAAEKRWSAHRERVGRGPSR